jgi:CelD/BcsL family acetyltransferase involved in cellulose biosynthesis
MNTTSYVAPNQPRSLPATRQLVPVLERISKETLPEVRQAWERMCAQGAFAEPFFQPMWFDAYADSFGRGQHLILLSVREGTHLRGVLPLMRTRAFFGRFPARTIRGLSGIHSCRYDLIHDGSDARQVARSVWSVLDRDDSWDVLEVEDVPEGGAFKVLMQEARSSGYLVGEWPTRRTPILSLPEHGRDPLSNCPKGFKSIRNRLPSKLRRLGERGEVSFQVHTSGYEEALKQFLLLEASGWKGANRSAIACNSVSTRFYSLVVEELSRRDMTRIYSLRVGERTIAMQLGIAMNGVYYTPKVAYDESFAWYSPGQLLNRYVIEDLCRNNFHTYDFLGPMAFWKAVWTSQTRSHHNCYIFKPSLKGRILYMLTMQAAAALRKVRYRMYGDPQAI